MTQVKLLTAGICALLAAGIALAAGQSMANDDRAVADARTPAKPDKCISTPVDQTIVIDRKTLLMTDYRGNSVVLTMAGDCMSKNEAIGIEYYSSGRVCRPVDVTITGDVTSAIPTRCIISKIEPISREDVEALKGRR